MTAIPESDRVALLRMLDANFNRAAEGLRVVEDFARFSCNDAHLSEICKSLRHDLATAQKRFPADALHAARDSQNDVGAEIQTQSEYQRSSISGIVAANINRAQQSLRVLEECAKAIDVSTAHLFEPIRYRLYTLEKLLTKRQERRQRLNDCHLYVLIDGGASLEEFISHADSLVAAEVDVIQLRDKSLEDGELLIRARALRVACSKGATLFIMNDRPDLAVLADADGVHVGQSELAASDVRTVVGPERLIGVSTHKIEEARAAVLEGADYLGVGPIFPSGTKSFEKFPGIAYAEQAAKELSLPMFAIGGIHVGNGGDQEGEDNTKIEQLRNVGITRIAVSGAVRREHVASDVARLKNAMR